MRFEMKVIVEVERLEGKFASRDELEQEIFNAISDANPSQIDNVGADGASSYEITSWEVEV
jgi:hypothetical protein